MRGEFVIKWIDCFGLEQSTRPELERGDGADGDYYSNSRLYMDGLEKEIRKLKEEHEDAMIRGKNYMVKLSKTVTDLKVENDRLSQYSEYISDYGLLIEAVQELFIDNEIPLVSDEARGALLKAGIVI